MQILLFLSIIITIGLGILYLQALRQARSLKTQIEAYSAAQKELLSRVEFSELLDSVLREVIDDGIVVLDANQRVLFANNKARELADHEMVGESLIASLRHRGIDELLLEVIEHDEQSYVQQLLNFNNNIKLDVQIHRLQKSKRETFYVLLLRDVTALKRAEVARREMVDNITHELNTPITTMNLVVETLDDDDILRSKKGHKILKEKISDLRRSLGVVTQLIEEMKILSEIQSGVLPILLQPTPLLPMIESAIAPLHPLAADHQQQIQVEIPDDIIVYAHAYYLERVVKNITHNAIKFSPENGIICITATQDEQMVTVAIKDNGIGIPADQLPRIFERFYQVDRSRDRARKNGTGLGLAIAKHIVQKHGGEIWVESEEGKGTTFFFSLYKDTSS